MFKALFTIIINLLATIIQLIAWPINAVIEAALPDISDKIMYVTSNITGLFEGLGWAVSFLPSVLTETLLFILSIEIAKHTIYISTNTLIKVWNVFQKIKFW